MTYVVTDQCIRCKYQDCVDVCPVDAFREGRNMLVIDPDACIDCGVCEAECPAGAILNLDEQAGLASGGRHPSRHPCGHAMGRSQCRIFQKVASDSDSGEALR